jgi:methylenetetrahydrofolate dehydrogenase (NADP+)/methenyltetrahydrofolate cyclohydrolase
VTATLIDGRAMAARLRTSLRCRVDVLARRGIVPHLAFVMLGDSGPARVYASRIEKLAAPLGIQVSRRELPGDVRFSMLEREVGALNADSAVDGILVQMPLPEHLVETHLSSIIEQRKDVDGITIQNAGRLYLGLPGHPPSTAAAILHILTEGNVDIAGRHAVVVGRSTIVGHPIAELLLNRDATVTITHRQTRDLEAATRLADILVVAAGVPGLITPRMISPGVVIIDAGITVSDSGVVGDVDVACWDLASLVTPVPGGVGPVTNAVLLRGVVESAEHRSE